MVKIVEFHEPENNRFDFDVVDDVVTFMRNDPIFYRKQFFPAFSRVADMHRQGKTVDQNKCLGNMVENALQSYCKKYKIAQQPDEVFNNDDREAIIDRIFAEEMDQIKRGEYK